jgi:polyphosphate kinase 2
MAKGKRKSQAHDPADAVRAEAPPIPPIAPEAYEQALRQLQIELVKLQREVIRGGRKILVILEGRDGSGKDGTIKRVTEHLSPRETRVVALPKPSDREASEWYFQRYVSRLPAGQELVLYNRSWYNRAGVERVMGFCTEAEYEEFMATVPEFEAMLVRSGIELVKYYLDITRAEQKKRLKERARDPLKQWKVSPIDEQAVKKWKAYSEARNAMFARTHSLLSPWMVVRAENKREARLNLIRDLLSRIPYEDADRSLLTPDPDIVFSYDHTYLANGMIAP